MRTSPKTRSLERIDNSLSRYRRRTAKRIDIAVPMFGYNAGRERNPAFQEQADGDRHAEAVMKALDCQLRKNDYLPLSGQIVDVSLQPPERRKPVAPDHRRREIH